MNNNDPFKHIRQVNALDASLTNANRRLNNTRTETYKRAAQTNLDNFNRVQAESQRQRAAFRSTQMDGRGNTGSGGQKSAFVFLTVLAVLFVGFAFLVILVVALLNSLWR